MQLRATLVRIGRSYLPTPHHLPHSPLHRHARFSTLTPHRKPSFSSPSPPARKRRRVHPPPGPPPRPSPSPAHPPPPPSQSPPPPLSTPRRFPMTSTSSATPHLTVTVTPQEQSLFTKVLDAIRVLHLDCTVRVAGGWVRDNLLGLQSDDIDFVLDSMSGREFAEAFSRYLSDTGAGRTSSIATIRLNPSQSKHLETTTFRIDGVSIDVNRFRDEVYSDDSRIPQISLSSATADALRRDFTINALFYNIHTREVEDYVHAIPDLHARLIRTPRPASKTFRDDPLRVLRAARFAARFGFKVEGEVDEAARSDEVHRDLRRKVSRERVGIELQKVLEKPRTATRGMSIVSGWGLRQSVLDVRGLTIVRDERVDATLRLWPVERTSDEKENADITAECVRCMRAMHDAIFDTDWDDRRHEVVHSALSFRQGVTIAEAEATTLLLTSYLVPYYGYRVDSFVKEKKATGGRDDEGKANDGEAVWGLKVVKVKGDRVRVADKVSSLQSFLIRESHIVTSEAVHCQKITDAASTLTRLARVFASLPPADDPAYPAQYLQLLIDSANALRSVPTSHHLAVLLTPVFESSFYPAPPLTPPFLSHLVDATPLFRCAVWSMSELLNGREVQLELHVPPGRHITMLKEKMMDWQIQHIEEVTQGKVGKEEALAHLRTIPLDSAPAPG